MTTLKKIWNTCKAIAKALWAPLGVVLLVVIGAILTAAGVKGVQIGGLLGGLLGKKKPTDLKAVIKTANSIPKERVDSQGTPIQIGVEDANGVKQVPVAEIESPGVFSDPTVVKFTPPGETKPVEVQLPTGVKAQDVEHAMVVSQDNFVVTVKNDSKVSPKDVQDLLKELK